MKDLPSVALRCGTPVTVLHKYVTKRRMIERSERMGCERDHTLVFQVGHHRHDNVHLSYGTIPLGDHQR